MTEIRINPDTLVYWSYGPVALNATIVFTWIVMAVLVVGSWLITRNLTTGPTMSRSQNLLEVIVSGILWQIREVARRDPAPFLPFVGTLFLFIAMSNLLAVVPWFVAPTSALSTTAALAGCVFVAVPLYGISQRGLADYLRQYLRPTPFMLPFNIIGEFSRTLALAVRLYGNIMSGAVIGAILLTFVPLLVPIVMQLFGLLTGLIQAYIFAVLAMVYIASAMKAQETKEDAAQGESTRG